MTLLVSACLLGLPCRYDGAAKPAPQVLELMAEHRLIPVCPEQLGGLPTPRPPAECRDGRVINRAGRDVTAEYVRGAESALEPSSRSAAPPAAAGTSMTGAFPAHWSPGTGSPPGC